jgi:hypothetical protein
VNVYLNESIILSAVGPSMMLSFSVDIRHTFLLCRSALGTTGVVRSVARSTTLHPQGILPKAGIDLYYNNKIMSCQYYLLNINLLLYNRMSRGISPNYS